MLPTKRLLPCRHHACALQLHGLTDLIEVAANANLISSHCNSSCRCWFALRLCEAARSPSKFCTQLGSDSHGHRHRDGIEHRGCRVACCCSDSPCRSRFGNEGLRHRAVALPSNIVSISLITLLSTGQICSTPAFSFWLIIICEGFVVGTCERCRSRGFFKDVKDAFRFCRREARTAGSAKADFDTLRFACLACEAMPAMSKLSFVAASAAAATAATTFVGVPQPVSRSASFSACKGGQM